MKEKKIRFIIDEGNSRVKIAAYSGNEWLFFDHANHLSGDFLKHFAEKCDIDFRKENPKAIFVSTRNINNKKQALLSHFFDVLEFTHSTPIPVNNLYETPETLGFDRLASAIGAAFLFPKFDILVIDAGTCITYDFIDAQKNYHGGGIMPGFQMKLQALHNFTEKLPLVSLDVSKMLLGRNTKEAILAGTVNVTMLGLDALITHFQQLYPSLKTVLCGGDTKLIQDTLKNNTFAEPNLVLHGLKQILDFNEDS